MKTNGSSDAANESGHINTAFVMLPTQLLAEVAAKKISEAAYTLYAFLKFWEGQNDHLWYGIPTMAERTGFSQGKVKRLIKELLATGHIARRKKMGANWHTKCLTYVDKTRTVFVAGEPVNREKQAAKSTAAHAKIEDVLERSAAASTEKPKQLRAKRPDIPDDPARTPKVSRPTVDQTQTEEEHEWSCRQTWNQCRVNIYDKIREHHPFPVAKELYLKRLAEDEEERRKYYAKFETAVAPVASEVRTVEAADGRNDDPSHTNGSDTVADEDDIEQLF